jgi:hypothetical protein
MCGVLACGQGAALLILTILLAPCGICARAEGDAGDDGAGGGTSQRRYGWALAVCVFLFPGVGSKDFGDIRGYGMAGLLQAAALQICLLISRTSHEEPRPSTRHNPTKTAEHSNLTLDEPVFKNNLGHSWVVSFGTRCCTLDPRNRHCHTNRQFHSNEKDEAGSL